MKIIFIFACSGMFRNVPACSGMFHVPGFIDGRMGKYKTKRSLGNLHLFNASRSFPSSKTLTFKISQGKKLSSENEFLLHDYRTIRRWKTGS